MFKKVLIPVDVAVAQDAKKLLAVAKTLTAGWSCELHVATVIPNVGMAIVGSYFDAKFESDSQSAAKTELATIVAGSGLEAEQHVLNGRIYDAILSKADELGADLILIGAHQPELSDYLLGANAARVVRHAKQSVMVIRGDDH